ncbi:unnamed protein product [Cyprideis torosa]|uniref:Uncharacterized protein n=1 Tax=Cyprideis torosa TaxID=163714 RepID=A0A7R8ZVT8_9CRUS|nr:unnamed protein product [Cyprideis torosa]CAG0904041.1 unnamed protein product [Cyprideis torosa]
MRATLCSAELIAATDANILLNGESGTGKELMARAIHHHSPRAGQPFIAVNCAALPETLAESLLFGHCKGVFTGADQASAGLIAAAHRGTLLLDEVGELSATLQAKLLRFLESGEILTLGKAQPHHVDVRVLAATHRDLYQQTRSGQFRSDLYYRLNIVPVMLPPLRDRSEDIELLGKYFLNLFANHHRLPVATLTPEALCVLQRHSWPGNIRELKNTCERLSILLQGQSIRKQDVLHHLSPEIARSTDGNMAFRLPADGLSLEALECDLLQQALQQTRQNRTRAARLLGITRDALNYRLKKHALI